MNMKNKKLQSQNGLEYQLLLENIQGGIVYSDFEPPFCLRYATVGMVNLSGYTQDELLNMVQMDLVHPHDKEFLLKEVATQFEHSNTFEVEYRLQKKDGSCISVLDRAKVAYHSDGNKYIHCLLTDITDIKMMEQALRLSEEKYKLAIQQSGSVVLEYETETDCVKFSENYEQILDCGFSAYTYWSDFLSNGIILSEDVPSLTAAMETVIKNAVHLSVEVRLLTHNQTSIWCMIHLAPVYTSSRCVYAVVGSIQNVDKHKRKIETLTEMLQKDILTNIYNRLAMETLTTSKLTDEYLHNSALIIMDIDYFKQVNDQNGHDYGDEVLIKVSNLISSLLPNNTVFGRLGGDEFLLFAYAARNQQEICHLAENIVKSVRETFRNETPAITVSLGVAFYTEASMDYKKIYKNADIALYKVKETGRNGFFVFTES